MAIQSRIIIIDDNQSDLDIARETFEDLNFHDILCYKNVDAVIDRLENKTKQESFIVLVDLNMPGKNGFDLLSQVKSNSELKQIPVCIYTSSNRNEDIKRAYELGASSYMVKPKKIEEHEKVFENFLDFWKRAKLI